MRRIGDGDPVGPPPGVRRAPELSEGAERALRLVDAAAQALRGGPDDIDRLAKVLREVKALDPEGRGRFLASIAKDLRGSIEQSFPPGSERRLELGASILRAGGTDPRGVSGKALEAMASQGLALLSSTPARSAVPPSRDVMERASGRGLFGSPSPSGPTPRPTTAAPATPAAPPPRIASAPPPAPQAAASADLQSLRVAFEEPRAARAPVVPPTSGDSFVTGLRAASLHAGRIEEGATLAREALSVRKSEGSFRERLQARQAEPRLERLAFRSGVVRELLAKPIGGAEELAAHAAAARQELSAIRGEIADVPPGLEPIEPSLQSAEGELRTAVGRAELAQEGGLSQEEVNKVGSALDPSRPPPQLLWKEELVNTTSDLGRKQGGLTEEQRARNGELARSLLQERLDWGAVDLVAVLKQSGVPLERVDPSQLEAAARYLNTAVSVQDQQEKLRKTLDGFHVLDKIGAPKLSRQQMVDQLWAAAKVPRHALARLSDGEVQKKFQEVVGALNGGPGAAQIKIGKHDLKLQIGEHGEVLKSSCKKPSFWSKVGKVLNVVVPAALTVLSFIPATAVFARAASMVWSGVQAARAKSVMGLVSFATSYFGVGRAALGKLGERLLDGGIQAFSAAKAIKQKNWGGALAGLAGAAAAGAGAAMTRAGEGVSRAAAQFGRIANHLSAAGAGVGALQSYRSASRAVSEAKKALERATAAGDSRAAALARRQLEETERAKRGALIGGASAAASVGAQYAKPALGRHLARASQGLSVTRAVHDRDYASAGAGALALGASLHGNRRLASAAEMAQAGASYHQADRAQARAREAVQQAKAQLEAAKRRGDPERIRLAEQAVRRAEGGLKAAAQGAGAAMQGLQSTAERIARSAMGPTVSTGEASEATKASSAAGSPPAEATPSKAPPPKEVAVVKVQRGMTVWEISMQTGVPVDRILAVNAELGNAIDPKRLQVGQEIVVPGGVNEVKFTPKTPQQVQAMKEAALEKQRLEGMQPPRVWSPEVPAPWAKPATGESVTSSTQAAQGSTYVVPGAPGGWADLGLVVDGKPLSVLASETVTVRATMSAEDLAERVRRGEMSKEQAIASRFVDRMGLSDWLVAKRLDGSIIGESGTIYAPGTPLSEVRGVHKGPGAPAYSISLTNGILTKPHQLYEGLLAVSDRAPRAAVFGVYNASEGFFSDLFQSAKDKLGLGGNPAVETVSRLINEGLAGDRRLVILGHSQGVIVNDRGIGDFKVSLRRSGLSRQEAERTLARLRVEGFGGAAWTHQVGPRYRFYDNHLDPVTGAFGRNFGLAPGVVTPTRPDLGAEQIRFFDVSLPLNHDFLSVYLPRWKPPSPDGSE